MGLKKEVYVLTALAALAGLAACAPTFSRDALDQVDRRLAFRELQSNPDRYRRKIVLVGGVIIDTRNSQEGTSIEVLQRPLDRRGRPRETDETEGRFIVTSPQFLDAAAYHAGKRISLVGEVAGQEVRPLGGIHYRYPLITAREVRLWEPRTSPQFSIGVGIGVFHHF